MQDWWLQLAPRERLMVAICGAVVLIALVWTMGIRPLFQGTAQLEEQVISKQSQLANLQELAGRARPATQSGGSNGPTNCRFNRSRY